MVRHNLKILQHFAVVVVFVAVVVVAFPFFEGGRRGQKLAYGLSFESVIVDKR